MIDDLLEIGAGFDWITPAWGLIQNATGGYRTISIDRDCSSSAGDIKRSLRAKGVNIDAMQVCGKYITFNVKRTQEKYAFYWLKRWGLL